jgi:hypothetical protein
MHRSPDMSSKATVSQLIALSLPLIVDVPFQVSFLSPLLFVSLSRLRTPSDKPLILIFASSLVQTQADEMECSIGQRCVIPFSYYCTSTNVNMYDDFLVMSKVIVEVSHHSSVVAVASSIGSSGCGRVPYGCA